MPLVTRAQVGPFLLYGSLSGSYESLEKLTSSYGDAFFIRHMTNLSHIFFQCEKVKAFWFASPWNLKVDIQQERSFQELWE
ncbi:hypothetical protein Syun_003847 [Stephania yunnanensis]|uniref:Uncharacterized protein n=1 Tax=Stephania yunnanensis TaxID=152371 RepID=A0AAP0L4I0_9MAGN